MPVLNDFCAVGTFYLYDPVSRSCGRSVAQDRCLSAGYDCVRPCRCGVHAAATVASAFADAFGEPVHVKILVAVTVNV